MKIHQPNPPISKLILILFLADDRADRLQGKQRMMFWKNMLHDFDNGRVAKNKFCWAALLSGFSPDHPKQSLASVVLSGRNLRNMVRNFICAGIWEAENLMNNTPPLPHDYLKKLKHSSGAEIAIHYLIYIQSTGIEPGLLYSPELKQLRKTLILLICLSNDLASLKKEENAGDFHNLVFLHEIHLKLNRKEAISKVAGKLEYLKEKYQMLQKQFLNNPGFGPEKKKGVCGAFLGLLKGCEIWAREDTGRYG